MHKGAIDWGSISEDDFNRLVEALLVRKYHRPPDRKVEVIDGRGGDGGIDVALYDDEEINTIFQLKHFREGFSGGFRETRRRQIKSSFETAWDNHMPPFWVLVIPANPTVSETSFISRLKKDIEVEEKPELEIWGAARLDAELSQYPEVVAAATRDPLVQTLKQIAQEQAGLVRSEDLSDRLVALHEQASGRSHYWETDFQVARNFVTQIIRAKHPRAAEMEPLEIFLSLNNEATVFEDRLREAHDYGIRQSLLIPGTAVDRFEHKGPEWFQHEGSIERLEIHPSSPGLPPEERISVALEFQDDSGFSRARHQGVMLAKSSGDKGVAFTADFYGSIKVDVKVPFDISEQGRFNITIDFAKARVSDAHKSIRLLHDFNSESIVQVLFEDNKFVKGLPAGDLLFDDDSLELLIEDLELLQRKLSAEFTVPAEITYRQRVMIRVARLILEGNATWMPPGTSLTGTLTGEKDEALTRLLTEPHSVYIQHPTFVIEIQGSKFNLGPVVFHHPEVNVRDADELLRALETGSAEGKPIILDPKGDKLIYVNGISSGKSKLTDAVPWNLPDTQ